MSMRSSTVNSDCFFGLREHGDDQLVDHDQARP